MSLFRLKGTSGPVINESWKLGEHVLIGSDEECDVRVESESLAPRHAEIEVQGGQVMLRLMENGAELHLNGQAITQSPLVSGDEIRIGPCRWLLQAPGLRPERVLTEDAVRHRVRLIPWLIIGGLSALALLAWRLGYLPF